MDKNLIIQRLPYQAPFLFVDALEHVDETGAKGNFTFKKELDFYKGHFKTNPVTPGVILTECCAQIGLVCLGIYLLNGEQKVNNPQIGLSSSQMEFYLPVFPGEMVTVLSKKIYFRFHKLKCEVRMYNIKGELVCKGVLSGMLKAEEYG
ncbi:MAG: hydroxymyristoyl-ACP dehydratase [Maribacter sp.]|nr:hydroxymyristoyl-ACP dehydratase [Maribacter sp.]MBT8300057.1 hydroxymyristoyl-ACP dehydratase [Maribacter sp.]